MIKLLFLITQLITIPAVFAEDVIKNTDTKLTKNQCLELLPNIKALHTKGPYIYDGKELKQLKYDWRGLSPRMVIIRHNNVDLIAFSKESKIIRHNFTRLVGAWSPKKAIWLVNYHFDVAEKEQINLGIGYVLSDEEYKKHRLYNEYFRSKP